MNDESTGVSRFTGIVPPMVTPLAGFDQLDVPGLERLIEHILGGGVHGLFILGTTGEGPSLSYRVRRELIERTCRQVNGRVPVLVGVTDTAITESLALGHYTAEQGADAVVIAPPYYFPAGQPELADYCLTVASRMPLPVVFYNMPACTKIEIGLDTLRQLLAHPNVRAYKDSSGQMGYLHKVIRLLKEFPGKTVLVGPEEMLGEATLLGAHGGVSGGANLFPRLYVDLYEAALAGDLAGVQRLHQSVMEVSCALYGVGKYGSSIIKGIKCALSCLGVCEDRMAEPFHCFHEQEREIIRERMTTLTEQLCAMKV
jgi:4-hydroxy-tetrahydrodipicolinate synthase